MKNVSATEFTKFAKHSPRANFPPLTSRKRAEQAFVLSFARAFRARQPNRGSVLVREFPLNGYGIADLVCLTVEHSGGHAKPRLTIQAFEMKMRDWRKAVSQAFRYRYFADKSIVVLPPDQAELAIEFIRTFKQLRVGLWSFEKKKSKVVELYTPPYLSPLNHAAKQKALSMLSLPLDLGEPSKRSYSFG